MIPLKIQLITLLFSFLYGIIFSLALTLAYHILYHKHKIVQIVTTFTFVIISVLIYFYGLCKANHGIIHPYALAFIVIGFLLETFLHKYISSLFHRKKKS